MKPYTPVQCPQKPVCEDPAACPECSMAVHCHERRVGMPGPHILWPAVVLVLMLIGGAIATLF